MSLTVLEKKELIAEMSLANYEIGTMNTLFSLKMSLRYGKKHEKDVQPAELWVKNIREEMP